MCVCTHVHGCDVILIGFPDLLHDFHLGSTAALNTAFDCDGSLWVVQCEVLKTAHTEGDGLEINTADKRSYYQINNGCSTD